MKLSAYVPVELWERVQSRFPGVRPSQVTQLALRRLVERSRPRFAAGEPLGLEPPELLRRRARVSALRQRAYDEGYEAGLLLGEGLAWVELERLAAGDWAVDGASVPSDPRRASLAHRAGMRDALRDVWLAVVQAWEPSSTS